MYSIAVYDWSQIAPPPELSSDNLTYDGGLNDPAQSNYNAALPSWTDKTYTFTGGSPTKIKVNDDDAFFEDGYVETGAPATLAEDVTINGVTYLAGSVVENEFSLVDGGGTEIWVLRIDGQNVGFVAPAPYYSIPPAPASPRPKGVAARWRKALTGWCRANPIPASSALPRAPGSPRRTGRAPPGSCAPAIWS